MNQNLSSAHKTRNRIIWILIALAGVYGIYQAINLSWLCDDAYISFRYARNLARGKGLVFNVGEHVEGYTNFLWTILMALGLKLKIRPEIFSQILGVIAYAVMAAALIFSTRTIYPDSEAPGFFFPLAGLSVLLHHEHHIFATSGLETSSYAMFLVLGFIALIKAEEESAFLFASLFFLGALLSRPDGLLFYAMSLVYIFLTNKFDWKKYLYFLLPLAVIYLPYWIIRYNYYGYPFPNTYYAKSAYLPYYSQGLKYLRLYFQTYYLFLVVPILILILLPKIIKSYFATGFVIAREYRAAVLSMLFFVPYIFYIVRVGGDFMFARFFIPITPILYIFLEAAGRLLIKDKKLLIMCFSLVLLTTIFPWNIYKNKGKEKYLGVIYEPRWYTDEVIAKAQRDGAVLKKYFQNTQIKAVFSGTQAMLAYYSETPIAVENAGGLTDEYIAHQPLKKRGRPGHEKQAPFEYLKARRTNFVLGPVIGSAIDELRKIKFEHFEAGVVTYDSEVMNRLKKYPGVKFIDFPRYLDSYFKRMPALSDDQVEKDYTAFKGYYFDYNDDKRREKIFLDRLMAAYQTR